MIGGNPEVASVSKRREVIRRLFGHRPEIEEIPEVPEIPPEVETAQSVSGSSTQLPQAVVDDQTGQTLVAPADPQSPQVVLPLTDDQIQVGLGVRLVESIRWLAVWCVRILKKVSIIKKS